MDGLRLQGKLNKAWGRAAGKTGLAYALYRPASAINPPPLDAQNIVLSALLCSLSNKGHFEQALAFGHSEWQSWHDAARSCVGDYLVGPAGTFFVAAQQPLLPPLLVQCNRIFTVTRPTQPLGAGAVGYGGDTPGNDPILLREWPASCLEGSKGEENRVELPLDVKNPWWRVLMPEFPGVVLQASDVLTDEQGQRYLINSAELTPLGWRLKTVLKQA